MAMKYGPSADDATVGTATCEQYVDCQLGRVQTRVRLSDLAARCMGLAAAALAFLMALIVVDHWIMDLGRGGRWLGLAILAVGGLAYLVVRVVPDLLRSINPAYAAWLVEQSEPHLKSSLINLVLLRSQRAALRDVVFREVEQQAAKRLSHVEVESSVDHTPLLRTAAGLMVVLILFGAYTIFSPKSPFQTLARVLQPLGDIPRPARVVIRDVQPGSTTVFAGRPLEISAIIESLSAVDSAWLVFSTLDQQIRDQRVPLTPDRAGLRYAATLPPAGGERMSRGVERDLEYSIEAGDALVGPFRVTVSLAPTIVVEEIQYEYPAYTKIPPTSLPHHGDISAVEGTKVTIVAQANQEIAVARVEFDAPRSDSDATTSSAPRMISEGRRATYEFVLTLDEPGVAKTQDYRLRFTSVEGQTDDRPVRHQLRVLPDLAPEIQIVAPAKRRTTLPLDGMMTIDLRGFDPDFGLSDMRLQMEVDRERRLDRPLLHEPDALQSTARYEFRPAEHQLQVGDRVAYRGRVKDNRRHPLSGEAAPNVANSPVYVVEITAALDQPPSAAGEEAGDEGTGDEGPQGGAQGDGGTQQDGGENGQSDGSPTSGEGAQDANAPEAGTSDQGSSGDPTAGDPQSAGEEGRAGGAAEAGQPGSGVPQENRPDGSREGSSAEGQDSEANKNGDPAQESSGSEASGDAPRAGAGPDDAQTTGAPADDRKSADGSGKPADPAETANRPLPSDGSADPDAFDRILEHMKKELGTDRDGLPQMPNRPQADPPDESQASPSPPSASSEPATDASGARRAEGGEQEQRQPPQTGLAEGAQENPRDAAARGPKERSADSTAAAGTQGNRSESPSETSPGAQDAASQNSAAESESSAGPSPADPSPEANDRGAMPDKERPGKDGQGEDGQGQDGQGQDGQGQDGQGQDGQGQDGQGQDGGADDGQGEEGQGDPGQRSPSDEGASGSPSQAAARPDDGSQGSSGAGPDAGEAGVPVGPDGSDASSQDGSSQSTETPEARSVPPGAAPPTGSTAAGDGRQGSWTGESPTGEASQAGDDAAVPEPGGDAPNLEYARKATTLALEYLHDQPQPDRELLERLGWSPEQLAEFVRRWEALRADADNASVPRGQAQSAWQEALQSLGLHPGRDRLRRSEQRDDGSAGMVDSGTRSQPPAEYREQFEAFRRSVVRPPGQDQP